MVIFCSRSECWRHFAMSPLSLVQVLCLTEKWGLIMPCSRDSVLCSFAGTLTARHSSRHPPGCYLNMRLEAWFWVVDLTSKLILLDPRENNNSLYFCFSQKEFWRILLNQMQVTNFVETKKSITIVVKDDNKLITAGPLLFETFRCWKSAWKFHGKV